jgi:hypothetical protein
MTPFKQPAYYLFSKQVRTDIKNNHPEWSSARVNAELGRRWRAMEDQQDIYINLKRNRAEMTPRDRKTKLEGIMHRGLG